MNLSTYICIFDKTIVIKYIHNLYSIRILHMLLPFPHLPKLPYPVLNLCVLCVFVQNAVQEQMVEHLETNVRL